MVFYWFASFVVRHPFAVLVAVTLGSSTCLTAPFATKSFPSFDDPQAGYETRGTIMSDRGAALNGLADATKENGALTVNPKMYLLRQNISHKMTPAQIRKKYNLEVYGTIKNSPSQSTLVSGNIYAESCVRRVARPKCCPVWSLPNYIAAMNGRNSCFQITEADVNRSRNVLQSCARYYYDGTMKNGCSRRGVECYVPKECETQDVVYEIMHFITSASFLPLGDFDALEIKETILFLPLAQSSSLLSYYEEIKNASLSEDGITVAAMDLGLKNVVFDETLIRDTWLLSCGGFFMFGSMWMYTGSIFLTFMTIVAIAFSLGIAYFIYVIVLRLQFFPFMNLLTVVVALGIGADDAFVFCKVWKSVKAATGGPMVLMMSATMEHAMISMIVTSLTTAAAFLASYISPITAIKCFSLFASATVFTNCVLMMFWFPACIVVWERYSWLRSRVIYDFFARIFTAMQKVIPCLRSISRRCIRFHTPACLRCDESFIVNIIIKFRYVWFILLSSIAIAAAVIVFYYPGLQLPDSHGFQLFWHSHPFEQYELVYKDKFRFVKDAETNNMVPLPLRFVWGVLPHDDANHLTPGSRGPLLMDDTFNMSAPDSQVWLMQFCRNLKKQPFYKPVFGLQLPNCFIETFRNWMRRKCLDSMENINHSPCCESESFPYKEDVFNYCLSEAMMHMYSTPASYYPYAVAGPKFSKEQQPQVKAVIVEFESNYTYSMSYEYMSRFATMVEDWFQEEMKTAPATMRNGFFYSDVQFYDLQRTLSVNTVSAVFISMCLSMVVVLFSTLNIITSIIAIVNITCSILVTMATLVLLGWKLNIIESIAISSTIGLSVDFTLHYTVNYKIASARMIPRVEATRIALTNMLCPVSMAAATTGVVGILMIPSTVMAYVQIGSFLLLVMLISWVYSTIQLGAMLAIFGPEYGVGHVTDPFGTRTRRRLRIHKPTDLHELQVLTSVAVVPVSTSSASYEPRDRFDVATIPV